MPVAVQYAMHSARPKYHEKRARPEETEERKPPEDPGSILPRSNRLATPLPREAPKIRHPCSPTLFKLKRLFQLSLVRGNGSPLGDLGAR